MPTKTKQMNITKTDDQPSARSSGLRLIASASNDAAVPSKDQPAKPPQSQFAAMLSRFCDDLDEQIESIKRL